MLSKIDKLDALFQSKVASPSNAISIPAFSIIAMQIDIAVRLQ